jgi:glycosyltransferase involved in cell wall biosynthesis
MKIGINLLWVRPATGIHTHAQGLLTALGGIDSGHQYVLFVNRDNHGDFRSFGQRFRQVVCNISAKARVRKTISEQFWLLRQSARERVALMHSLANVAPLAIRCPSVLTLHDVAAFAVPETYPPFRGSVLRLLTRGSAKRAAAIVTVTEFSRRQIVSRLGVAEGRVFVIHNGVAERRLSSQRPWPELQARLGITSDYVLAFSGESPQKNIDNLLRAFARVRSRETHRCRLVIAGRMPLRGADLPALARGLGIADSVVFTGHLDDLDVAMLLAHASLLAFPSRYEGFGLPALEAMQSGVPVACSNAASLPEVAGQAARYFDPYDIDQMSQAIDALLSDAALRDRLIEAGRENLKRFSWPRAAERTLEIYQRVASAPGLDRPGN